MLVSIILLLAAAATAEAGGNAKGIAFLEENKKKEGVITLPSGLQVKIRDADQRSSSSDNHACAV